MARMLKEGDDNSGLMHVSESVDSVLGHVTFNIPSESFAIISDS